MPERTLTERYGSACLVSMGALAVEAAVLCTAYLIHASTRETSVLPGNYGLAPAALVVFGLPALLLAYLVTVGLVLPLTVLAAWTGRRVRGRDGWWWLPVVVAAACGLPVMAVALPLGAWRGGLALWPYLTVLLTVPALAARRVLPRAGGGPGAGRVIRLTLLYGAGAVAVTAVLGLVGSAVGLVEPYERPRLTGGAAVGVWSDGRGGTLRLAADGTAEAAGVDVDDFSGEGTECTGRGTWRAVGAYAVDVRVEGCANLYWESLGTREHPQLFAYVGDPDSGVLYRLRRTG
ncbi:hypothetical protein [Streptomyces fradiae]|uniref:hypothetical protein n=1 Tax=Streptomyces fradiae TaxID=1906 RepID=UPI0029423A67|nr:hypothetical protein [Streptomyces fradiae]WOI58875.1 hypothetical protein RYQ63_02445 [Streptomyces fradiae]